MSLIMSIFDLASPRLQAIASRITPSCKCIVLSPGCSDVIPTSIQIFDGYYNHNVTTFFKPDLTPMQPWPVGPLRAAGTTNGQLQ